jgi:hypothetical protein
MPTLGEQMIPRRKLLLMGSECVLFTGILFFGSCLPPLATRPLDEVPLSPELLRGLLTSFTIAVISQTSLSYNDLYDWRTAQNRAELPNRLLHACGYALVMLAALVLLLPSLFYFPSLDVSDQTWKLILLLGVSFLAVWGFRHAFHWFFYKWRFGERVLVLGAGVAGLQAISTAKKLGAVVEANDIRPACKEQVESLGGKFVDTGTPPDAETKGGYAQEATQDFLNKQREILTKHITAADVLITTALVPGKKAPVLVTADMRKGMKPGSVIVDMAASMGGNVEGTKKGERVVVDGVTILGDANLPAQVAGDASRMFARNVVAFLGEFVKAGAVNLDMNNEILGAVAIVHDGQVRHQPTAQALAAQGS